MSKSKKKLSLTQRVFGKKAYLIETEGPIQLHKADWSTAVFGKAFLYPILVKDGTEFSKPSYMHQESEDIVRGNFIPGTKDARYFVKHLHLGFTSLCPENSMPYSTSQNISQLRLNEKDSTDCLRCIVEFVRPRPTLRTKRRIEKKYIGNLVRLAIRLYSRDRFFSLMENRYNYPTSRENFKNEYVDFATKVSNKFFSRR